MPCEVFKSYKVLVANLELNISSYIELYHVLCLDNWTYAICHSVM